MESRRLDDETTFLPKRSSHLTTLSIGVVLEYCALNLSVAAQTTKKLGARWVNKNSASLACMKYCFYILFGVGHKR